MGQKKISNLHIVTDIKFKLYREKMDEIEDDVTLIPKDDKLKRPAKISTNDKAALLSSGDEEDDDDEEEDEIEKYTGEILHSVDYDEGVSVSGSDDEISGHTAEQETYIGDSNNNLDQIGIEEEEIVSHLKISKVKEGTLIAINDGDVIDDIVADDGEEDESVNKENDIDEGSSTPPVLPTNDNISEIANKLKEADLYPKKAAVSRQNKDIWKRTDSENRLHPEATIRRR